MATRLLVCAATQAEIDTFLRAGEPERVEGELRFIEGDSIALSVTGVGIPCTLLRLPPLLELLEPGLVLNIGIAGAYPSSGLGIGEVAMARAECFGDIGFELPEEPGFRSISEAPFGAFYTRLPMTLAEEFRTGLTGHACVEIGACTVNACTGTLRTGLMRERLFEAGMESMEGAAAALACERAGVPMCELRAISNIAADRDMRPENIRIALERLRDHLQACRRRRESS